MTTQANPDLDILLSTLAEQHPHTLHAIRNATDREAAETGFRALLRAVYGAGYADGEGSHAKASKAAGKK